MALMEGWEGGFGLGEAFVDGKSIGRGGWSLFEGVYPGFGANSTFRSIGRTGSSGVNNVIAGLGYNRQRLGTPQLRLSQSSNAPPAATTPVMFPVHQFVIGAVAAQASASCLITVNLADSILGGGGLVLVPSQSEELARSRPRVRIGIGDGAFRLVMLEVQCSFGDGGGGAIIVVVACGAWRGTHAEAVCT